MTIVNDDGHEHEKSLSQFHRRLRYLCYDTIIKGVKLTDTKPFNCLSFLQGKQTTNVQSRKDSGLNSPIDVIDGKSVPT